MNNNIPSIVKVAFKIGFGAYLGWQAASFSTILTGAAVRGVIGTPEDIGAKVGSKIADSIFGKKA